MLPDWHSLFTTVDISILYWYNSISRIRTKSWCDVITHLFHFDSASLVLFMTVGIISPVINLVQALPADVSSCKVFDALSPVCRLPLLLNKFNEFPTSAACISFRLSNVFRENEFLVKAIITKNFFMLLL